MAVASQVTVPDDALQPEVAVVKSVQAPVRELVAEAVRSERVTAVPAGNVESWVHARASSVLTALTESSDDETKLPDAW
jgi:hypothetical protein